MRLINPTIQQQLASGQIRPFAVITVIDQHYTDCDVPLATGGKLYEPRGMEIGDITYSTGNLVDSCKLTLDNLDDALTTQFVGGNPQGQPVSIGMVLLDENYQITGATAASSGDIILWGWGLGLTADALITGGLGIALAGPVSGSDGILTLFSGEIDDWTMTEGRLEITVASQFARWSRKTFRTHSSSCRWLVFKGPECGYSGPETWCDRSYDRCVQLGNQDNFGGFRWLPSLEQKNIWWGQVPK